MPGRRLGQHFLTRKPILERIAAAAVPSRDSTIVEIGPGKGSLTEHLLERAARVIAIEVDSVLVHYLQQKFRANDRLTVLNADVLKTDLSQWGRISVAGNLPYYITSPIVERVLRIGPLLENGVFLVQKEVAERIAAHPGTRDYGYLSVQTQLFSHPKLLFNVAAGSFQPPPKVESAVVQLTPRAQPLTNEIEPVLEFMSACFRQKRKTIRNNLAEHYAKAAIDAQPEASLRAEQLTVEQFIDLRQRILKFP
jgi:16S rRNA (adenine1518-N6/adenine1519-N6)-dimethyltransferase